MLFYLSFIITQYVSYEYAKASSKCMSTTVILVVKRGSQAFVANLFFRPKSHSFYT